MTRNSDGFTRVQVGVVAAILLLSAILWLFATRLPSPQRVNVEFRPTTGTAQLRFARQEFGHSPICSCNTVWRGLGLPINQFSLDIPDVKRWSVMIGPMDRTTAANWWPATEPDFDSTVSVTVLHDERRIYRLKNAAAGIVLESTEGAVSMFADTSYSALIPANDATVKVTADPFQIDGQAGGLVNFSVNSPRCQLSLLTSSRVKSGMMTSRRHRRTSAPR